MGFLPNNQLGPTISDVVFINRDNLFDFICKTDQGNTRVSLKTYHLVKKAIEEFNDAVQRECSILPDYDQPISQISKPLKKVYQLKLDRLSLELFHALLQVEQMPDSSIDTFNQSINLVRKQFSPEQLERLIKSRSYSPYLRYSLDDFFKVQQIAQSTVGSYPLLLGESEGILYKIQQDQTTCGYLFGTIHLLHSPELEKAGLLSPRVIEKLATCRLLGTEIKFEPGQDKQKSVEESVCRFAHQQGLIHIGIDTSERDRWDQIKQAPILGTRSQILEFFNEFSKAYQKGSIHTCSSLINMQPKLLPYSKERAQLEEIRNEAMSRHIHTLLKASTQSNHPIPKSFFAIGTAHLLFNGCGIESVVSKLEKKGWELVFCSPSTEK
jgi:hypothetical protein